VDDMKDMDVVYRRYALPLKKFVMTLCKDEFLADDIVADTFYKAITHIDSWRGGNIFTWLCTIAKNQFLNHVKKKETQNASLDEQEEVFEIPAAADSPLEQLEKKEQKMVLFTQMQKLSAQEREVMYLRAFADLSFKEIGEVLKKTENWARVTYFRCKDKIRRQAESEA